jgi:hypothetical protein
MILYVFLLILPQFTDKQLNYVSMSTAGLLPECQLPFVWQNLIETYLILVLLSNILQG